MPALCGMSRMPYPRFLAWNALGLVVYALYARPRSRYG